jgi:tellurium resistance protein TerD
MTTDASHMHKGEEVDLLKIDPALHRVSVGLGWDAPEQDHGFPVDLDASAFLLNRDGRVRNDTDFVFYNHLETEGGTVRHLGDSTTGKGDGDKENIEINLEHMPYDVEKVAFAVTIHNAQERAQNFGLIKKAYIRIINLDTKTELAHFDLTEDAADETGFIFGELVRDGVGWKFRAVGQGSTGGLYKIARDFNVNVAPV